MKTTVTLENVELDIEYDYYPAEKEIQYRPDGSGHPGYKEYVSVSDIKHKGTDMYQLLEDKIDEIENLILKNHGTNRD